MMKWLVALMALLAFSQASAAQVPVAGEDAPQQAYVSEAPARMDLMAVPATSFQPCVIRLPNSYDSTRAYPLIVGLHGYGSNPERFMTNWNAFSDPEFIYACPRGPYIAPQPEWMGYSWLMLNAGDYELEEQARQYTFEYIHALISKIRANYPVSDVYLLGFSLGSIVAYQFAFENPEEIAGIACIAGPIEYSWIEDGMLEDSSHIPVFLAQGTADEAVPPEIGRESRDFLLEAGFDVTYHEYEAGHTFDAETLRLIEQWIEGLAAAE